MRSTVGGEYNSQNVWNMDPEEIHYHIADWVLAGNTFSAVGDLSLIHIFAYDLINDGYIQGVKIGNAFKIPKVNVINYVMEERREKNAS